jgi:hypothetical protein
MRFLWRMIWSENRVPLFGIMRFRLRMIFSKTGIYFRRHARAEKKCAASPGGTFFILLPAPTLSTTRPNATILQAGDSITPQEPILKENLLVARREGLENLARMLLPIVAFRSGSTTSRVTERFLVHP